MKKSKVAFLLTARGLFESHHRIYFWTVTFCELHSDWECSGLFSAFLNHLREVVGRTGWGGVRVCELHKERGVHYHMLVTERLAVDLVRRIGRCHGVGRIQVERADSDAPEYLSKYLTKQRSGPLCRSGRAMRRWAAFGDVPRVRKSDIENVSPMWVYRREQNLPFLSWAVEPLLWRAWDHGEQAFRSVWFALRKDLENGKAIACGVVSGRVEARGMGDFVERLRSVNQPF